MPTESKAATAVANQSEALRPIAELLNSLLDISKLEADVITPISQGDNDSFTCTLPWGYG